MEEELSTACRAAADALEILSNLGACFTRNVILRMNSTALSVSQPNNEDRQANNEELQSNERSTSPASSSSIQARLSTLFPTVGSNRANSKALVEDQQGQRRTLSRPKAAHPRHLCTRI